jgi:hypothetical protein
MIIVRKYENDDDDNMLMERLEVVFASWLGLAYNDAQKDTSSEEANHEKSGRNNSSVNSPSVRRNQSRKAN